MERLTKRVTFANVVALMALVLAMAGTGVADPLAHSAATTLGIAKQANKRAVNATKSSEKALKRGSQALTLARSANTRAGSASALAGSASTKAQQALDTKLGASGTALNADKLDGLDSTALKVRCATGLVAAGGVCFEATARPEAGFFAANNACSAAGRRLPGLSELYAYGYARGMSAQEWTDMYHVQVATDGSFDFSVTIISVPVGGGMFGSTVDGAGEAPPLPLRPGAREGELGAGGQAHAVAHGQHAAEPGGAGGELQVQGAGRGQRGRVPAGLGPLG